MMNGDFNDQMGFRKFLRRPCFIQETSAGRGRVAVSRSGKRATVGSKVVVACGNIGGSSGGTSLLPQR